MKKFAIFLFLGFIGLALQAQEEKKAAITFESDTVDYGEIERGSNGVRQFKFTNTGNAVLVISNVYSTCGCTIPKKPENPIQPGETGVIEVKYDTKRPAGPIRKTITVYSNASPEPYSLKIKGMLVEPKGALDKEKAGPTNG